MVLLSRCAVKYARLNKPKKTCAFCTNMVKHPAEAWLLKCSEILRAPAPRCARPGLPMLKRDELHVKWDGYVHSDTAITSSFSPRRMSRNKEYVNPTGLRLDGRRPLEARKMSVQFGTIANCDGSCTVDMGSSRVCASVFGPQECITLQDARRDAAVITCEVAVAAFSGLNRRNPQRRSKLSEDVAASVVQVVKSVVLLGQYPNSQIHIFLEILQQDGSEKVSCINAACLALIDANVAMRDAVACVNAGLIDNNILIDLTNEELRSECPVVSVAFAGHGEGDIIWVEMASRLSAESVEALMKHAQRSAADLFEKDIQIVLREHAAEALRLEH